MKIRVREVFGKNALRIIVAALIGAALGLIIKLATGLSILIVFACQILCINIEMIWQKEAERKKQKKQNLQS